MRNQLAKRLENGFDTVNGWLSIPSGYSAEIMSRQPWDSLTIDLQHGVQDYASMVACLQAISASGITPLVRVLSNESGIIGKVLDAGAWGVICPMVNTADEARRLVSSCLYAPLGHRSFGPNRALAYGEQDQPYQSFANGEVLIIPMIETAEAIQNLEAILDVPGVSGIYIGPTDLAISLGYEPRFDRQDEVSLTLYADVARAARARNKFAGMHCMSPDYATQMTRMGFAFVTVGSDAYFIGLAAQQNLHAFHAAREQPVLDGGP